MEYLSDEQNRSVQEIKNYLADVNIGDYTEGQFAGSLNTLVRNGSIRKIDRGTIKPDVTLFANYQTEEISRDDFLEALVTPRLSKMKEIADTAKKIGELAEMFQSFSEQPLIDKKGKDAIAGITKLGEIKAGKEISCVFNFEDKMFPIIAHLNEQYFNVSQDQFVGQVYMLCKIQRKITKGQPERSLGMRRLLVKHYSIIYVVEENNDEYFLGVIVTYQNNGGNQRS